MVIFQAYVSICDLLIYFSEQLYSVHYKDEPKMQWLVYEADDDLGDLLNAFVQTFVFDQQHYGRCNLQQVF